MQQLRSQSHISVLSISFPPFSWIKQKHKKKPTLPRSCPEGGKCHLTSETSEKTSEIWDFTPKFFGNMKLRYKKNEALLKSHWNKKTQHFGQVTLSKYFLVRSLNDSHGFRAHKKNKSLGTLGEEASRDGFSRNHFGILQILFRILLVSDVPEEVAIQDNYTTSEKNPGCEKMVTLVGYGGPFPVTVANRIITFLVGNPYKPLFVTVTGRGPYPNNFTSWKICLSKRKPLTLWSHDSTKSWFNHKPARPLYWLFKRDPYNDLF